MSFENESRNNSLRICEDKIKKIKETIESLTAEIADLEAEIGRIKAESDEGESRKADISIGFPDKNAVNGNYEGVSVFKINKGVLRRYKGSGGDVVIPNSVTSIEGGAFYNC